MVKGPIIMISLTTIILLVSSFFKNILSELTSTKVVNNYLEEVDKKLEHLPIKETYKYRPMSVTW